MCFSIVTLTLKPPWGRANKMCMYESMLNLLFFVLFVCFIGFLVAIASLDLKVTNVSWEKE